MSPAERARKAKSSGRSMMQFVAAAERGRVVADPPLDAPFEIEDTLEVGDRCSFETTAGTVDTIATPRATRGYVDLVAGADRFDIGDCYVLVPSLDDLVLMKVDGIGEQDWFSLHYLQAVRKRQAVAAR
jgi:hypothetical protein